MLISEARIPLLSQESQRDTDNKDINALDAFGKSRRSALIKISATLGLGLGAWALFGPSSLVSPGEARAANVQPSHGIVPVRQYRPREGWAYAPEPWQDGEWGPLDSEIAAILGLTMYFNPDNPAQCPAGKYDLLHTQFTGQPSDINGEMSRNAAAYLARSGGTREWSGMCKGLVDFSLLRPQPMTEDECFPLDSGGQVVITYTDRVAIGSIYHSGDIKFRPTFSRDPEIVAQQNVDYFINRLRAEGRAFGLDAGRGDKRGKWYRAGYGVSPDGLVILATNLGLGWVEIPREQIVEAYDPLLRSEAEEMGLPREYFDEIDGLKIRIRYDDSMDYPLVNRILYGE